MASPKPPYLAVYAGHDSVIAPVLASLGIFQHKDYCKWPSYASRIVFELWERNTPVFRGSNEKSHDAFFVRVLYNGNDVTSKIPMCKDRTAELGKSRVDLCPLRVVTSQWHTLLSVN